MGDGEAGMLPHWAKAVELVWRGFSWLVLLCLAGHCWILIGSFLSSWVLPLMIGLIVLIILVRAIIKMRRIMSASKVGLVSALKAMSMRMLVDIAQPLGFSLGVFNRPTVEARRISHHAQQLTKILDEHPNRKGVIIYPPTHDWGFMFQSPHQLARAFADKGYVYFFATKNEKTDAVLGLHPVAPNLYLNHVPMETFKQVEGPIVIIGSPWGRHLLDCFDRPRVIYDHYDEIEIFSANPQDHDDLLALADIVLVSAERLKQNIQSRRQDLLYIPNGVDYKYIQTKHPGASATPPPDMQPILNSCKPIVELFRRPHGVG
jgi:hypothetical protein